MDETGMGWCVVAMPLTLNGSADRTFCWCCGQEQASEDIVHLGEHPEMEVCLRGAHFLTSRRGVEKMRRPDR
jgi:hypothetical protein